MVVPPSGSPLPVAVSVPFTAGGVAVTGAAGVVALGAVGLAGVDPLQAHRLRAIPAAATGRTSGFTIDVLPEAIDQTRESFNQRAFGGAVVRSADYYSRGDVERNRARMSVVKGETRRSRLADGTGIVLAL